MVSLSLLSELHSNMFQVGYEEGISLGVERLHDKGSARRLIWASPLLQAALLALQRQAKKMMRHRQHLLLLLGASLCSWQSLAASTTADTMRQLSSPSVQHRQHANCRCRPLQLVEAGLQAHCRH